MENMIKFAKERVFRFWKSSKNEEEHSATQEQLAANVLRPYESYVVKLQNILIWENTTLSVFCVLCLNFAFWLIATFENRFYSVSSFGILLFIVYDLWVKTIWPEIRVPGPVATSDDDWVPVNPNVLSVPEISRYLNESCKTCKYYYGKLKTHRQNKHGSFCLVMSGFFTCLAAIGCLVPGIFLTYILLMVIMIGPGIYLYVLPSSKFTKFRSFWNLFLPAVSGTDSGDEEYLPEENRENMALLKSAGESFDAEVEEDDSKLLAEEFGIDVSYGGDTSTAPASLAAGVSIPAFDQESVDDLDAPDFDISNNKAHYLDPDQSDEEEEEEVKIHFQSTHFNGDESSDEEKVFSEGLSFAALQEQKAKEEASGEIPILGELLKQSAVALVTQKIANVGSATQDLISSVIFASAAAKETQQAEESSGDSDDFEMITEKDVS